MYLWRIGSLSHSLLSSFCVIADAMLCWQSQPPRDFHSAKQHLIESARRDQKWRDFQGEMGTRRLLGIAFAHDVSQEPVYRDEHVTLPEGCRINSSSSSSSSSSSNSRRPVASRT